MEDEFPFELRYHLRCLALVLLVMAVCSVQPLAAAESFISPAPAVDENADEIGPAMERRDALGYDPTRHSLFPDVYYRYRSWREKILQKMRLETLFSYDMLGQGYVDSDLGKGSSAGDATFSGRWLMFGQKYNRPVYLSFNIRHRHAYSSLAPSQLSFDTGLIWRTTDGFTDAGLQIPRFYVSQELVDGKLTTRYGQISIDSFFDNHKLRSAKQFFLNQIFSANPSVAFPTYGAGFTVQWLDTRNWDIAAGGSNIQGTDQEQTINFSLDSSAFFYTVQGGYNFEGYDDKNARVQLLAWQSKSNNEDELSDGSGISLTLEHAGRISGERFVFRYAFSDGDAALVDQLFMFGWGREIRKFDHLGFGIGMGRSAEDSGIWQGVAEVYYRWQVTKELMITPDVQIIMGDGLKSNDSVQMVAGLRAGITF